MPNQRNNYLNGHGRLKIGTFAVDIGKPVGNATIRIAQKGNGNRIIEEFTTDSSGQSPTIELAAPPLEFSLSGRSKPYSEYDIQVMMDGYESQIIEGVQILPNTTAQQDIRLNPVYDYNTQARIITVREHALWGTFPAKIPEDEIKELPPSLGHVVLPDPVVPEFIIVHDGRPENASAPNYWIPFTDYIKNVASCEIYSTWPEQTITANIMAILSFTLNRVYTEWYTGKGYNFTITSSTAFDHAYNHGRNIFSEISTVVDNIFTTFITKPEIRQPLFAQYCDGRKVSCPKWMSQWESKALGDQGYSAVDILKRYYGQDIYLMQARKVAGVPRSYPGEVLQMGSVGENVRVVQEQLNAVSNNYPAIKKVRNNGIFGEETRKAVVTFQNVFNLSADGIVGFATWYKLSHIYVSVMKMAELN